MGGQIVVVDDKVEEATPLLTALAKNGAPHLYYSGEVDLLPELPLTGVRFVFLDIELAGMAGQSDKNKASGLAGVLKKVISEENGPYVVVFWTTHIEVIEIVKAILNGKAIEPVAYITANKALCLSGNVDGVVAHLNEALKGIGAFELYVKWENTLNSSGKKFVSEFANNVSRGLNWSKNTADLFYWLYKAFVDKNELADKNERFRCACNLMNRSFVDSLHRATIKDMCLPDGFLFEGGGAALQDEIKAKLNNSLFLSLHDLNRPHTGYVYLSVDEGLKTMLLNQLFKDGDLPQNGSLCTIVVTPECDLAQNKTLMCNGKKVQQVIHGIIYKMEKASICEERSRFSKKGSDSRFIIAPIWYDNKVALIVTHFATLSFTAEDNLSQPPIFALRRDVIFDLQSKASNHVNRLGNFIIE